MIVGDEATDRDLIDDNLKESPEDHALSAATNHLLAEAEAEEDDELGDGEEEVE